MNSRIALVSAFHLTTDVRMVKEANALAEAGYHVEVFAGQYLSWAEAGDAALLKGARWQAHFISYDRGRNPALFWYSRFRRKIAARLWPLLGKRLPLALNEFLAVRALDRVLPELRARVMRCRADLYIGHGTQALPIVVRAARRHRALAGFDAEDFNSGMRPLNGSASVDDELVAFIERRYIRELRHLTAAAPGVAAALRREYSGVEPVTVLNVFPLSDRPPSRPATRPEGPLRLYWFSQTIGRDRGLEDAVRACGLLPQGSVELHLRGNWQAGYETQLRRLWADTVGDRAQLFIHPALTPDQLVRAAAEYDVGLALEVPVSENRMICMRDLCTNKVYTYLLAGLAVAASGLEAQRSIYEGAGFVYTTGDAAGLAAGIRQWTADRRSLETARETAWRVSGQRYNWDVEKQKLLDAVERVLTDNVLPASCQQVSAK